MGTSKGYIAPTRIEWSRAKGAVTSMMKNPNNDSIAKAASRYASAMKSDGYQSSTLPRAASGILGLARSISSSGSETALRDRGLDHLIGKPNEQIFNELLQYFGNNSSTGEDALAVDALSLTLKNLHIEDLDSLGNISEEAFLKELIITYAELNFEYRFTEKIGKTRSPADAANLINQMKGYIRGTLYENLKFEDVAGINFTNLEGEQYIIRACNDAFTVFEELYEE